MENFIWSDVSSRGETSSAGVRQATEVRVDVLLGRDGEEPSQRVFTHYSLMFLHLKTMCKFRDGFQGEFTEGFVWNF